VGVLLSGHLKSDIKTELKSKKGGGSMFTGGRARRGQVCVLLGGEEKTKAICTNVRFRGWGEEIQRSERRGTNLDVLKRTSFRAAPEENLAAAW